MNIAICDDEKIYRDEIEHLVDEYFADKNLEYDCKQFSCGKELADDLQTYDIVFLDIEMEELNGIETAKALNKKNRHTVIFIITAYHKYLDDAMDLDVFRYIDKPIDKDRFFKGLEKAIALIDNNDITFKTADNELVTISKNDIVCVEVMKKKVTVSTVDGDYVAREKMDFFRNNLTASYFAIPHKSYIVNFNYIRKFKRDEIELKGNRIIAIAPKKQAEIKKQFVNFIGEDYGN